MASEPSDEDLMGVYADHGNAEAFSELYHRFESRLYGFFLKRLSFDTWSLALDLFQKTWLKVHRARHRFDRRQKFSTWLFSIALNVLRDEWRLPGTLSSLEEVEEMERIPSTEDQERDLSLKEDLARLEGTLSQISDLQREALILSEWEGFSSQELAKALGISEAAARQTVSRARKKVREIMKEDLKS